MKYLSIYDQLLFFVLFCDIIISQVGVYSVFPKLHIRVDRYHFLYLLICAIKSQEQKRKVEMCCLYKDKAASLLNTHS